MKFFIRKRVVSAFLPCLLCLLSLAQTGLPPEVNVYADAKPGDSVHTAIEEFFRELNKAGKTKFSVRPVSSFRKQGIAIWLTDRGALNGQKLPAKLFSSGPESVFLKGDGKCLVIAGNSALAIQQGLYLYLEKLGFRYLMPGEVWEDIPAIKSLFIKTELLTSPDYEHRNISNGHGYYNKKNIADDFAFWLKANRMGGAFQISVGHSYDAIVSRNIPAFKEHPEYFAQTVAKGVLPPNPKFDITNKGLVQLVVADALKLLDNAKAGRQKPMMISTEPSDGSGFCSTPACKAIGDPSDQAFYLSNIVAREIRKKHPGTWVGLLAYNEHILPPKINIEPNTFTMVTNGFNRTGLSTGQLLREWKKKVSKVGVYEYLSVYEWDFDLPGQVTAAKISYLKKSVNEFYNAGARAYLGESTMGWISRGPGQYILARLLWDKGANTEIIKKDFFDRAFGNVSGLMQKLYADWEEYPHKLAMENDLANWLEWVNEADQKAQNEKIRKRIEQVKLYLHYVVLYRNLKVNPSEDNLQRVMSYAYRNFEVPAFATLPVLISLPNYNGFPQLGLNANPVQKYKQNDRPFSSGEIQEEFQKDIRSIKRTREVSRFKKAESFVKLSDISSIAGLEYAPTPHAYWGITSFVIHISKKGEGNYFEIFNGHTKIDDKRNVTIDIYPYSANYREQDDRSPVAHFEQEKVMIREKFSLGKLAPGFYLVRVNDFRKMFELEFSPAVGYSIQIDPAEKIQTSSAAGLNVFYFYVPAKLTHFRISKTAILKLWSPAGRLLDFANNKEEIIEVEVKKGESGLWTIFFQSGNLYLEGIPPYLGSDPSRMLVPSYLKK